jgi:hypothetical protein
VVFQRSLQRGDLVKVGNCAKIYEERRTSSTTRASTFGEIDVAAQGGLGSAVKCWCRRPFVFSLAHVAVDYQRLGTTSRHQWRRDGEVPRHLAALIPCDRLDSPAGQPATHATTRHATNESGFIVHVPMVPETIGALSTFSIRLSARSPQEGTKVAIDSEKGRAQER